MQRPRDQALVVTLGSPLAGEDAVGQCVHEALQDAVNARLVYLGTDIFRFSNAYHGEPVVIVVDAVYSKQHAAGEMIHFTGEEVFSELNDVATDAHLLGVGEGLKILRKVMPRFPDILHFIGVSCKHFGHGEMSQEVKQGIEQAVALVHELTG
ncbi:MAG: hydrogenase maturation protease [Thermoplasmatota archaeon]